MIELYVGAGVLALLILLFVAYLICAAPVKNPKINEYKGKYFAHRGLHGEGRAENSMSAFKAAIEGGYGIELDIRLSSDGKLVVFHDDTLDRVCAREGRVIDFTAEELSAISLSGTEDGVPLFSDVLTLVDGRVPILVEIKENQGDKTVSDAAAEMLKDYRGEYLLQSFNPISVGNFAKKISDAPRGILSQDYLKEKKYRRLTYFLLGILALNRVCKPCFIAFNCRDGKFIPLRLIRRLFGVVTFAWTVRSAKEESEAKKNGFDVIIFENYIPENK